MNHVIGGLLLHFQTIQKKKNKSLKFVLEAVEHLVVS